MGEKEKLFLRVEHQLTNVEGIVELEYHYLINNIVITYLGKNHQYVLQLVSEIGYLYGLKLSTYKILINYIGEKSNFTMEKSANYHLNQMIKVNSNEKKRHQIPPNMIHWERHNITSVISLTEIHNLNLITRKHQTNPNRGISFKISRLYSLENAKLLKDKDWQRKDSRLKETKRYDNKCSVWYWIGS